MRFPHPPPPQFEPGGVVRPPGTGRAIAMHYVDKSLYLVEYAFIEQLAIEGHDDPLQHLNSGLSLAGRRTGQHQRLALQWDVCKLSCASASIDLKHKSYHCFTALMIAFPEQRLVILPSCLAFTTQAFNYLDW